MTWKTILFFCASTHRGEERGGKTINDLNYSKKDTQNSRKMHISSFCPICLPVGLKISHNMQHGCPGNLSVSETFPGINLLLTGKHTHRKNTKAYDDTGGKKKDETNTDSLKHMHKNMISQMLCNSS